MSAGWKPCTPKTVLPATFNVVLASRLVLGILLQLSHSPPIADEGFATALTAAPDSPAMTDLDNSEDKLNILTAQRVLEDEEDEGGAGIDYRRMFKG